MLQKIRTDYLKNKIVSEIKSQDRYLLQRNVGYLLQVGYDKNEVAKIICNINCWDMTRTLKEINWMSSLKDYAKSKKDNCDIKKNTPLINAGQSPANIPDNIKEITSFRFGLIPDSDKNKKFFRGSVTISYGFIHKVKGREDYNKYSNKFYPSYNPLVRPYYRSIKGDDHVLFVADLDRNKFGGCFDALLSYAKSLYSLWDWDIVKFSGSEGLHLIKYLPKNTSVEDLKLKALEFDPDKKFLDWHLFNTLDWNIRGYCVNWKTGFISDDVDLETFVFPKKQEKEQEVLIC